MTATIVRKESLTVPQDTRERASARAETLAAWGTTVLRITLGVIFVAHGYQKLFGWGIDGVAGSFAQMGIPLPKVSAILATGAELLGGAALVVGLFTRLAAIPLAFTMLVALTMVHLAQGFFLPNGFEYTFALLGGTIAIGLLGSGRAAIDNFIPSRR